MRKKRSSGFTLIEMMVGVTIVGIMSALSVPLINEFTGQAHKARFYMKLKDFDRMLSVLSTEVNPTSPLIVIGQFQKNDSNRNSAVNANWYTAGGSTMQERSKAILIANRLMPPGFMGKLKKGYFYIYFYLEPRSNYNPWQYNRYFVNFSTCGMGTISGWSDNSIYHGQMYEYGPDSGHWANPYGCT